jgi:hypothetical protein
MVAKAKAQSQARPGESGSWMALLAATTLGHGAGTLHAEVRAEGVSEGAYRLVVQSYAETARRLPDDDARPIGSLQRAVTADELRRGVHVNLLELREACGNDAALSPTVVAWIESGKPDLEFDGRKARPRAGSVYGIVKRRSPEDLVQINLDRRFAAA